MTAGLMVVVAMAIVFLTPVVLGTSHLSFAPANATVSVTRSGCGVTKLCVESPDDCDPAGSTPCLFSSALGILTSASPIGVGLAIQLSGESDGYIAVGTGTPITAVFVCAQNSSAFFFRTAVLTSGGSLIPSETTVTDIRGTVNGSLIQCEFTVPITNVTDPPFLVLLGNGSVDGAGVLGNFNIIVNTTVHPNTLATPAPPTPAPTTPAPPVATTGDGRALRAQAVLVVLGALAYLLS